MTLASEYLPAIGLARQELVLLHGWGMNREVWRPLLAQLRSWANVTLVDIPGCAPGIVGRNGKGASAPQLADVLDALIEICPERAVFIGWSLGGQLATELVARFPQRACALITLCTNPRFVADGHWPGMDSAQFSRFTERARQDPESAVKRFLALQAGGAANESALRRQLRRLPRAQGGSSLLAGLNWLGDLDQRALLAELELPRLNLFAECDALVPVQCVAAVSELSASPSAQVVTMPMLSHLALLEAPAAVTSAISGFLEQAQLLPPAMAEPPRIEKLAVADSFSRAASTYDSMAHLQRDVGQGLLGRLDAIAVEPEAVLDLGCGTGFFRPELQRRFPQANYIGLDIAEGMVDYARSRGEEQNQWLVADAEALPLASESVELVFSSLALQWCYRPSLLFAELFRVLRPGGVCVFTSLGPDTLKELRSAWAAVDEREHVNEFLTTQELEQGAAAVPGLAMKLEREEFRMEYERVRDLLAELKAIGAHNMNRGRPEGLTGRRALQGMLRAYEQWRQNGVLPATYDVIFGVLEKP